MKFADYLMVLWQHTVIQMSSKSNLINTCQRTQKDIYKINLYS